MYNKMSFINETDYAELVGLCGICPIVRKVTNYAQNYARAYSHNSTIPKLDHTVTLAEKLLTYLLKLIRPHYYAKHKMCCLLLSI